MSVETHEGVEIDKCPRCAGIFLDWGELTNLLQQTGIEEVDVDMRGEQTEQALDEQSASCSRCEGAPVMRPVTTRFGVRLDTCGKCGGTFLDAGEFRRIVQALAKP